jgi:hypothetical protein
VLLRQGREQGIPFGVRCLLKSNITRAFPWCFLVVEQGCEHLKKAARHSNIGFDQKALHLVDGGGSAHRSFQAGLHFVPTVCKKSCEDARRLRRTQGTECSRGLLILQQILRRRIGVGRRRRGISLLALADNLRLPFRLGWHDLQHNLPSHANRMRMNRRIWTRSELRCFIIQPDLHRQPDSISIFARLVDSVSPGQPIRERYRLRRKVGVWNVEHHTTAHWTTPELRQESLRQRENGSSRLQTGIAPADLRAPEQGFAVPA